MHVIDGITHDCRYEVAWCTKYRRKVLQGDIENRLAFLLVAEADNIQCEIACLKITEDTVRMRISVNPQYGINRAVRHLKGLSSRTLRSEFPELKSRLPCLWTSNYFVITESPGQDVADLIEEFVQNQERSQSKTRKNQEEK